MQPTFTFLFSRRIAQCVPFFFFFFKPWQDAAVTHRFCDNYSLLRFHLHVLSLSLQLVNGSSDNRPALAEPSSFSSGTSSLFSSSSSLSIDTSGDCYTIEAHLPLAKNNAEQLEKFHRLLSRLDTVYNQQIMSTTALPPSSSHINDRYLFRSLSNDNNPARPGATRKNKLPNPPSSSTATPPEQRKRYKFAPGATDQNNNSVYKFPTTHGEPRSHSTDSSRYYFPPDESAKKSQQTLTYVRAGNGLEQRSVTFIGGTPTAADKLLSPSTKSIQPTAIAPDTPYLFSKTTDSERYPSATSSSVHPEGKRIQCT